MMKFICTISALIIAFSVMGCDVQPTPQQRGETPAQPGVVQEPIALPQDAPQTQDYYQQQGTVYPPQQQMAYPQQQGMVYPQQQMVYPQQQGMVYPQQQGMAYPQQPGNAYQQQLPVSQDAIELPLGVEPKPGMEIIQEPGQAPRLVYQDGTPVGQQPQAYPEQAQPQVYPGQGQPSYGPPVTSGPPVMSNQPRIQETPETQGLTPGTVYQQGPNGQLVPVPPDSPNTSYQTYPQYPQTYPQQQGQVYYPPQQGATMQKRDPSGQMMVPGNGYSQPYGAPQPGLQPGMVGQQPYYPPNNADISYPPQPSAN